MFVQLDDFKFRNLETNNKQTKTTIKNKQTETDVYRQTNRFTLFFGIPCHGGDYNNEPVKIPKKNLLLASEALVVLINELHRNFETQGRGLRKTVSFDGNLEHPEFKES